jgi:hypothetical protein
MQMSTAKTEKKKDPVVYALSNASRCFGCDRKMLVNDLIVLHNKEDEKEVYCLNCEKLDHLQVLKAGDPKITRLAKKYSTTLFVVMKWSDTWKFYERQGLLVEPEALAKARKDAES